jgi:hypothetical protein
MSRCKQGNSKKQSRFICLKCMNENKVAVGIQRLHGQREWGHIKDLYCLYDKEETKNLEVRYCDIYSEMMKEAKKLHKNYYRKVS